MTVTGRAAGDEERALLLDVLSTLLREDVVRLRTGSVLVRRPDGDWLRLPVPGADSGRGTAALRQPVAEADADVLPRPVTDSGREAPALLLPVTADGFQSEYAARLPLLLQEPGGRELTTGEDVLAALRALAAPEDRAGFTAFADEYRDALTALRLRTATRADTVARLTARHGGDPAGWTGLTGALAYDTLAARHGHPVHPTSAARSGLTGTQLRAYAPEFAPRFALRWLALPREAVTVHGADGDRAPDGLGLGELRPSALALGLPQELDGTHVAFPVHPLTADGPLRDALRATGLDGRSVLADRTYLDVAPTLSTRTVAVLADPGTHLKLPLATSTLGLLNRRTIKPGSLIDGAAGQRLLETVTAREPRFRDSVLHADETRFAHAGHELLAVLVRRHPPGLDGCAVLPMAALLAEAPDGRPVVDHLADRYYGGDPLALFDAVLTLLLDWQTTLFGYGIALESHQQNISLLLDDPAGRTRLRLLLKDDDGLRVNRVRLRAALGPDAPERAAFDDPRILVDDDGPVADLFTTITVHLCAGAYAFALARLGRAPLEDLLDRVRDLLDRAARRLGTGPGEAGETLRARVLDAPRLPVKAMVSAGTLLTKDRSGATDINKHYTTGPNYLLRSR
nr:IucA/IucC family protein [Streptomyces sp. CBMA29]